MRIQTFAAPKSIAFMIKIQRYLESHGESTPRNIRTSINLSESAARKYLSYMAEQGMVRVTREVSGSMSFKYVCGDNLVIDPATLPVISKPLPPPKSDVHVKIVKNWTIKNCHRDYTQCWLFGATGMATA